MKKSVLLNALGNFLYVENAPSLRTNDSVRNQFILHYEKGEVFQSYRTLIGIKVNGGYWFTPSHDCSVTTSKYCTDWCGYSPKERREGIKDGQFAIIENE